MLLRSLIIFSSLLTASASFGSEVVWHKWDTESFVITSLDKDRGLYLFNNIEDMKRWSLTRWGLPNVVFSTKCYIFLVNTRAELQRYFGIDTTHGEIIYEDGRIEDSILWVVLDGSPQDTIMPPITYIALKEIEQRYNTTIPYWAFRGIGYLNSTPFRVRERLRVLRSDNSFSSVEFFSITEERWLEKEIDEQKIYDAHAIAFVLFLYNEGSPRHLLRGVRRRFQPDHNTFERVFRIYLENLGGDIVNDRVPNHYLLGGTND